MPTKEATGNEIMEILDQLVDSEVDAYEVLDELEYVVDMVEAVKATT